MAARALFFPAAGGGAVQTGTAVFSGAGSMAGIGGEREVGLAEFAGAGTLVGVGTRLRGGVAVFSGAGQLVGLGGEREPGAAVFVGVGALVGVGGRIRGGAVAFTGAGQLVGMGGEREPGAGVFAAAGTLVAVGRAARAGLATFVAAGQLSAVSPPPLPSSAIAAASVVPTLQASISAVAGLVGLAAPMPTALVTSAPSRSGGAAAEVVRLIVTTGAPPMKVFQGTRIKIPCTFTQSAGGTLFDPAVVKFSIVKPDGGTGKSAQHNYTYGVGSYITRTSIGLYTVEILIDFAGTARYRWESTATGEESAAEGSIVVPKKLA
ncbi:MAG: hypothetical protein M3R63_18485 [Actinomycetota bacterium]|nr:hypothetical protein [Actinomycetota bacterium]